MPLNTVGYNIKKLIQAGLIEEKKHFFSVKGKRVPFYKVSNKHIVLSPKKTYSSQLKSVFPVVFISAIFTFFILWYERNKILVQEMAPKTEEIMITGTKDVFGKGIVKATDFFASISMVGWFLIIIWFIVIVFIIFNIRNERRFKGK